MSKKYMLILFLLIAAVGWALYGFDYGEPRLITKHKHASTKKVHQVVISENLMGDDDMVAAILIMPKSYLPALKRFSQSPMARDIKILRAQIELEDGQMTAVQYKNPVKPKPYATQAVNTPPAETRLMTTALPAKREKQMLSAGFLYLMASIQKRSLLR